MRQLTILLFISMGCASTKQVNEKSKLLNGNWVPVKQEMGGALLPRAVFEKQKLIILDSTYTMIAESADKGVVKYGKDKMDIYGKEGVNAGKHFRAIYKIENRQLVVCYNLAGDSYPETYDTRGKPMYFLSVFEKK
jgi:uncharacterized protein (TIGR03067 family)